MENQLYFTRYHFYLKVHFVALQSTCISILRALTRIGDDPLTEEEFQEILSLAELDPDFEAFFDYKDLTNHKLALSYASKTTKSEDICVS